MLERKGFSDELNGVMSFIENELAKAYPTPVISLDYFVTAVMLTRDCTVNNVLQSLMSLYMMKNIAEAYEAQISNNAISVMKPGRGIRLDDEFNKMIEKAKEEAMSIEFAKDQNKPAETASSMMNDNEALQKKLAETTIGSEHIFLAIMNNQDDNNKIRIVFNKAGVNYTMFLDKLLSMNTSKEMHSNQLLMPANQIIMLPNGIDPSTLFGPGQMGQGQAQFIKMNQPQAPGQKNSKSAVEQYCININNLVAQGKIDRLIGRDNEMREIIRALGKRRKNNIILVGGEGCGKTAIAENVAAWILDGKVPKFLMNKTVISLDMTALIAGTTLRGMLEERTKMVIDEIKQSGNYILIIDNIGAVLGHKKDEYDISAMLSTALEKGELQVVGTSDFKSYRSSFDKDPSLSRRFQKLIIEPSSKEESVSILNGLKGYYEDFHHVKYSDEAIFACVELADRYITERNLPDSAIDILDEVGSLVGRDYPEDQRVIDLKNEIKEKNARYEQLKKEEKFTEADDVTTEIRMLSAEMLRKSREIDRKRNANPPVVFENAVIGVVSSKTGIPITKLTSNDKAKMYNLADRLKSEVIGQDEAVNTICNALKRNRVGLHKAGCMFSALCLGRTGVGKTLIAKKLALEMFGSEKSMIRFDMSEYPDKSAVNKLIGSNPGYIGYEDGGQLTEAIKNRKHCVLLLDEIEKADPEVYNIFLQVLDEGFLTDNSGMKVDFKNVIVLFTSNVGAKVASDFGKGIGFVDDEEANSKRILTKELKNRFPPEFLNRLDNIVYFNKLTEDNMRDIIRIELGKMIENVKSIGYGISYDDTVIERILKLADEEREFGARPIMRIIRNEIENKFTDMLLLNDYEEGREFNVTFNKEEENFIID